MFLIDLVTDVNVVIIWILGGNYGWAIMQILIIVYAQAFSAYNVTDKKCAHHNIIQLSLVVTGFGRLYFGVRPWGAEKQFLRFQRLKVWEMIFESFPTVALQFYIVLRTNSPTHVLASLIVSFISISFTFYKILLTDTIINSDSLSITNNNSSNNNRNNGDSTENEISQQSFLRTHKSAIGRLFIAIGIPYFSKKKQILFSILSYIFIVTDMFTRIFPTILLIAIISNFNHNNGLFGLRIVIVLFVIGLTIIYEFYAYWHMLNDQVRKNATSMRNKIFKVCKYFIVGCVTSSYYFFGSVGLKYLPKEIIFHKFFKFHCIRAFTSAVIFIVDILLQVYLSRPYLEYNDGYVSLFVVCLVLNVGSIIIMRRLFESLQS